MQATRGGQSLLERAEHEGEDDLKRAMESSDRIGEGGGVLRDRCRDPGMSELQEESAPRPKEDERLSVDLPDGRARTKYSLAGPGCLASDGVEAALKVNRSDHAGFADAAKDGQSC